MQKVKNEKEDIFSGKKKTKWFLLAAVFFILILVGVSSLIGFNVAYAQRFYPGVKIGFIDVAGKTKDEVRDELKSINENVQSKGLMFEANDKEISINPIVISTSPDLAKEILVIDINRTIDEAYGVGRSGNMASNVLSQLTTLAFGRHVKTQYVLNKETLIDHLKTNFSEEEKEPINAALKIVNDKVEVTGEQSGYLYDYDLAVSQLENNIANLNFDKIKLDLVFTEPTIKKDEAQRAVNVLDDILNIDSLELYYAGRNWKINKSKFISWLEFQRQDSGVIVGFNQDEVIAFLETVAKEINVKATDAKFEIEGDRVTEFQSSKDGKTLNIEKTFEKINDQISSGGSEQIELVVEVEPAKVANDDLNDLGIKELLGRGTSNFSGSPVNRRHNIQTGVNSLDGVLIAPDEEFSLLDALGEIDGENGYLQELVIKGDRTVPEYGGGLCQIGSTTFRAALWSGLPITARRNHSYRVRYYEPAGMDATIYDPAPDMKFLNDTGYHVLFIARMEGDDLVFEFYGTSDGRKVTIEPNPPTIYNVTQPGPPRYIETEDLAPGEKKKVESAHAGADTYFKYTVEYADGRVEEEDFNSHYVAWPEVWLIGKDPNATSSPTTTDEIINN